MQYERMRGTHHTAANQRAAAGRKRLHGHASSAEPAATTSENWRRDFLTPFAFRLSERQAESWREHAAGDFAHGVLLEVADFQRDRRILSYSPWDPIQTQI